MRDARTYAGVKRALGCVLEHGPETPQERWENQGGWSPATIASEIAGLVTGADLARGQRRPGASAALWRTTADEWQASVEGWTATTNGPYSPKPYYLRITKDGNPNAGTTYNIGDSGPENVDQRKVVDPSYLELVRLGVKRADDPVIRNTLGVVDQQLGVDTPNGRFWHRFDFDGYGEKKDGSMWDIGQPRQPDGELGRTTSPSGASGRSSRVSAASTSWPPGSPRRRAPGSRRWPRAASPGHMIAEQVWDQFPPSGSPGFPRGEGTFAATPLAWSHAQLVRLAWSIDAGRPVERPSIVERRYRDR